MEKTTDRFIIGIYGVVLEFIFEKGTTYTNSFTNENIKVNILRYFKDHLLTNSSVKNYVISFKKVNYLIYPKNPDTKVLFLAFGNRIDSKKTILYSHISFSQFLIIFKTILIKILEKKDGFILHASAILVNNKAHLFLGDSGTGKTTLMHYLSGKNVPLADDSVVIRKINRQYYTYQNPQAEINRKASIIKDPILIDTIFSLKQSNRISAKKVTNKSAVSDELFKRISIIGSVTKKDFKNIIHIVKNVDRFYILEFTNNKRDIQLFFKKYFNV